MANLNDTTGTSELASIKDRIDKLSPPEQLRLAAHFMEHGKFLLAENVAGKVVDELRLMRTRVSR